jgi:hypothetical protein
MKAFFRISALLLLLLLATTRAGVAQSDLIVPVEQYSSERAKGLATVHAAALRDIATTFYYCLPWLEVQRGSIGFFKPKAATRDDRYLSIRVYVEQEPSAAFAHLSSHERAGAMFSRYVGPVLRRLARDRALVDDADLAGFTVIVEWVKPGGTIQGRPVHETIAAFMDKPLALQYVGGRLGAGELAHRSRVQAFDGETAQGEITFAAWDDDFLATYRAKNYTPPGGVDCRIR